MSHKTDQARKVSLQNQECKVSLQKNEFSLGPHLLGLSAALLAVSLTRCFNYLIFHNLSEIFSIFVSFSIFVIAWNTRQYARDSYILFIGIAYLFIGWIDLLHTLAFPGMSIFPGHGTNLATQLWIISRHFESIILFIAPSFINQRLKVCPVFILSSSILAFFTFLIFMDIFPVCFIEGKGLTQFKKVNEYVICLILLGAFFRLNQKRDMLHRNMFCMISGAILMTICSELSFTLYKNPYGAFNLIGHLLKIISFYLIYLAFIRFGLREPYHLLYHRIQKGYDALEKSVRERTADLSESNRLLNQKIAELKQSEKDLLLFKTIIESSQEAVAISNAKGNLIYINPAHEKLFGRSFEQARNMNYREYYPPESVEILNNEVAPALARGKSWEGEMDVFGTGGRRFSLWSRAGSVCDEAGNMLFGFGFMHDISEQRNLEHQLRRERDRNQQYLDVAGMMFIALSKEQEIVLINKKGCEILGYTEEELIGKNWFDYFISDGNLEEIKGVFNQIMAGNIDPVEYYENPIKTKDGTKKIIAWHNSITRDEHGNINGLLSSGEDITARKKAEAALRKSEERLNLALEAVNDGLWDFLPKEGKIYYSPRWFAMLGYEPDELPHTYETWVALLHPDDLQECQERVTQFFENKAEFYSQEFRMKTKEDGWRWINARGKAVERDHQGNIIRFVGTHVDIHERKIAEESLRKMNQRMNNILESLTDGFFTLNQDMKVTYFNPAAERLLKRNKNDVLGRNLSDAFPEAKGSVFEEKYSQALREKSFICFEVFFGVKPYEDWYDVRVYPFDKGISVYFQITTERKKTEEMMIQTEKMMSVGGLAAGMAHEINNPLAGILQSVQNVTRRISPELPANEKTAKECGTDLKTIRLYMEQRGILNMLEGIRQSGKKAAEIVENMLRFSRRSESRMMPVNLANILERTIELASHDYDLKKKYDFRNIEIIREYDPDMPNVPCSETEIGQVILNLLRNSAQAMGSAKNLQGFGNLEGLSPQIILRLKQDGNMARIEVGDNGVGMDEKTRKRVFEPFFTTKEVGTGTGLGLSVSYFIITTNHNGTMSVESEPGRGSRFIFSLPLKREG